MKVTEIKYKKMENDEIQITSIKNCADLIEIEKEFGKKVRTEYQDTHGPRYSENGFGSVMVVNTTNKDAVFCGTLSVGGIYSKEAFQDFITTMKAAAKRLIEIRKEHEASKVKTIKI